MPRPATNLQITVVGVAALLVLGGVAWFGLGPAFEPTRDPGGGSALDIVEEHPSAITVHVSGAVAAPGVVDVPEGSRVSDTVVAAGGATIDADLGALNLAAPVRDGDHITVPTVGSQGAGGGTSSTGVDLNTATSVELETLPGVGPVLAQRIVAFRDENGRFETVEDLLDVPGIGEAKLDAMRGEIDAP